ncbi:class F sortase [Streptomyces harbinensis]|uniref:Sortase family protein n=1 Tax=Streptomyces harbinensis TaxID=1176198 RepID=A0A1I6VFR6_9ACTN|nr:class F sortase [Streptomyces harbinensis]QKV67353.1 class F sortase [Streptomyces harbinensis]SFT12471.1 Sortase family protein [Streptomyces harbinensis]
MHLTSRPPPDRDSWGPRLAAAALGCALVLGLQLIHHATAPGGPPQPAGHGTTTTTPQPAHPQPAATPTRVTIPTIGVDAPLTPVGLDPDGWLQAPPPEAGHLAGWYADAPAPGTRGTAVLTGHVDTAAGPAVFYALGTLTPGDTIGVHRDDGTTLDFTVHEVAVHDKDRLPERVYADTGNPELRVLTCGGTYHPDTGYTGNVVVYATLTGTR